MAKCDSEQFVAIIYFRVSGLRVICLFGLLLFIAVYSFGHARMLPPFYGTYIQLGTSWHPKCASKFYHPSEKLKSICMDGLTSSLFLGTSGQAQIF